MTRGFTERPARNRSRWSRIGAGVAVSVTLFAAIIAVLYVATGRYRPSLPPPHPIPVPNGLEDYIAAGRTFRANGGAKVMFANNGSGAPILSQEKAVVAANQPVLALLRQAFHKECAIPSTRRSDALYPYLADAKELARLLTAEADVRAAGGDSAGAVDACLDAIEMGIDLSRGGTLIHGSVSCSIQGIAQNTMADYVDLTPLKDYARLAARLETLLGTDPPASNVILEDGYRQVTTLSKASASDFQVHFGSDFQIGGFSLQRFLQQFRWRMSRDTALREVERTYREWSTEVDKPRTFRRRITPPRNEFAAMALPEFENFVNQYDVTTARNRLLLCALKIRAYRAAHNRLPVSLTEVSVDPRFTMDPYSGRPLQYRLSESGFLLYSVGPDGRDDGGLPADESAGSTALNSDIGVRSLEKPLNRMGSARPKSYQQVPYMKAPHASSGTPTLIP